MLVEFASVVDAVGYAAAIQRGMVPGNESEPEDRRIVFRITSILATSTSIGAAGAPYSTCAWSLLRGPVFCAE